MTLVHKLPLGGGTITLTGGELKITKSLTINGPVSPKISVSGGNTGRVFSISNGVFVAMFNLAVTHGRVAFNAGGTDLNLGGGIENSGTLELINCAVFDNTAVGVDGGGIGNHGTLLLENSSVYGNVSSGQGGGISNFVGTATLTNSTVLNNAAYNSLGGGGIFSTAGSLTLTNSIVSNIHTSADGGGIYSDDTSTDIFTSTISANTALLGYGGGGIYNSVGMLSLSRSTVSDNSTGGDGGGINNMTGTFNIADSTISGNTASRAGGGIIDYLDEPSESSSIAFSTIYRNVAKVGGGIAKVGQGRVSLSGSIIAGDHAEDAPDAYGVLNLSDANLIQSISGTHIVFIGSKDTTLEEHLITGKSPLLGPLQNNGGSTQTHALLPKSPALDVIPFRASKGTDAFYLCNGSWIDQRGVKRPQGPGCDLGAYEYTPPRQGL